MRVDGVFEGGGVRGTAFVGAIEVIEQAGYEWMRLAGTSAGSIIASLLACGYKAAEIKQIMADLDYDRIRGNSLLDRVPLIGDSLDVLVNLGIYNNEYLEEWLYELLAKKGVRTFADLPEGKLKIIASDLTSGRMLVFPDDLHRYGLTPDQFTVAQGVRMSANIPFFFEPVIWQTPGKDHPCYIVDGGILSNFPIWIFDVEGRPDYPTFGFKLSTEEVMSRPAEITGPFTLYKAMFKTMLQAHDLLHLDEASCVRTMLIPTGNITSTQFELSDDDKEFLYRSGIEAAHQFLDRWDFEWYKAKYRSGNTPHADPATLQDQPPVH